LGFLFKRLFVPIAYSEFAKKEQAKELELVDVVALKKYFGVAVAKDLKASESQT